MEASIIHECDELPEEILVCWSDNPDGDPGWKLALGLGHAESFIGIKGCPMCFVGLPNLTGMVLEANRDGEAVLSHSCNELTVREKRVWYSDNKGRWYVGDKNWGIDLDSIGACPLCGDALPDLCEMNIIIKT